MTSTIDWAGVPAGDLRLLDHPLAAELLATTELARFAYSALDGTPRVIPVGWLWRDGRLFVGTMAASSKVAALRRRPEVALTIDRPGPPPEALLIRGRADVTESVGPPPEYVEMQRRYYGTEQAERVAAAQADVPMALIAVTPTWVSALDFQTRFPRALTAQGG